MKVKGTQKWDIVVWSNSNKLHLVPLQCRTW